MTASEALEKRIDALEKDVVALKVQYAAYTEASNADRKRLHDILDRQAIALSDLKAALDAFKFATRIEDSRRVGYFAGAVSIITLAGAGLAFLWDHLVSWISKH